MIQDRPQIEDNEDELVVHFTKAKPAPLRRSKSEIYTSKNVPKCLKKTASIETTESNQGN